MKGKTGRKQRKEIKGRVKKVRGIAKAKAAASGGKKKWAHNKRYNHMLQPSAAMFAFVKLRRVWLQSLSSCNLSAVLLIMQKFITQPISSPNYIHLNIYLNYSKY